MKEKGWAEVHVCAYGWSSPPCFVRRRGYGLPWLICPQRRVRIWPKGVTEPLMRAYPLFQGLSACRRCLRRAIARGITPVACADRSIWSRIPKGGRGPRRTRRCGNCAQLERENALDDPLPGQCCPGLPGAISWRRSPARRWRKCSRRCSGALRKTALSHRARPNSWRRSRSRRRRGSITQRSALRHRGMCWRRSRTAATIALSPNARPTRAPPRPWLAPPIRSSGSTDLARSRARRRQSASDGREETGRGRRESSPP